MVVKHWNLNFSTRDSSFLNLSVNVSSSDHLIPRDQPGLSRTGHTIVAVFLGMIFVLGFISNLLVILIFARFQSLRTPINLILLNISVSDMLVCIFGTPFSFAASLYGRWLLGQYGCKWYGFANALFGIVSLVSLAFLSYERYSAVLCPAKADASDYRKAWLLIAASWLYSLAWTLPPVLGWSSYGPEGPGTTCSVQWHRRSAASVSYVVCLFVFCLLLPLVLMVYCYGKILLAIRGVAKINQTSAQRRENHILVMVVSMVSCYMLCWMPYGVVALLATFGRANLVSSVGSIVPSVLAKSSTVLNPIIYLLLNKQFYRCFVAFMRCWGEPQSNLHIQQSSREDGHFAGVVLLPQPGPGKPSSLTPSSSGFPSGVHICALHQEGPALVLVVRYTAEDKTCDREVERHCGRTSGIHPHT